MEMRNLFTTRFRGSLDKGFTAYERKGKQYLRKYTRPTDRRTEVQIRHRLLFTKGVETWKAIHDAQREFYSTLADKISGYNLFLKRWIEAHTAGLDGFDYPVVLIGTPEKQEDGCFLELQTERKLLFQKHLKDGEFAVAMSLEDAPYEIVLRRGHKEEVVATIDDVLDLDVPMTVESEKLDMRVVLDVPENISPPEPNSS